jgi:hypothetical protein
MSGDDLRVTTTHLGDLGDKQRHAAVEIRSATMPAEGAEAAVRSTHGSVSFASANAVTAILAARRSLGEKMAAVSDHLCDKLTEAAKRYEQTDDAMSGILRTRMQTGQT